MSKTRKKKIEIANICPECSLAMYYNKDAKHLAICSECWIKYHKKITMKKGIFKQGWDKRILQFNNQTLLEKLKDVLERNEGANSIRIDPDHFSGPFIFFTIGSFGSFKLNAIFHYWGLNWKDHIKEFRVSPTDVEFETLKERWDSGYYYEEENEDNDDFDVRVSIWLHQLPDILTCKHEFQDRSDWGYSICCKCGLFEYLKESDQL